MMDGAPPMRTLVRMTEHTSGRPLGARYALYILINRNN